MQNTFKSHFDLVADVQLIRFSRRYLLNVIASGCHNTKKNELSYFHLFLVTITAKLRTLYALNPSFLHSPHNLEFQFGSFAV